MAHIIYSYRSKAEKQEEFEILLEEIKEYLWVKAKIMAYCKKQQETEYLFAIDCDTAQTGISCMENVQQKYQRRFARCLAQGVDIITNQSLEIL